MRRVGSAATAGLMTVVIASALSTPTPAGARPRMSRLAGRMSTTAADRRERPGQERHRIKLHVFPRCSSTTYPGYLALPLPGFVATARQQARRLIAKVKLPSGTIPVTRPPIRSAGSRPLGVCDDPETVGYYDYWRSGRTLQAVMDWIKAHPPAGSILSSDAESSDNGTVTSRSLTFEFLRAFPITTGGELFVSGMPLSGGRTAIRVDADVSWLILRPHSEQVPNGVSTVTMTFEQPPQNSQQSQPSKQTVQITDPRQIEEVVWLTDLLPVQQPGPPASCPAFISSVDVKFQGANRNTLAEADDGGCDAISFSIDGKPQDPLSGGDYYSLLATAFDSGQS